MIYLARRIGICGLLLFWAVAGQSAEWMTSFKQAQSKAAGERKLLLLNFSGSDWCGWCQKLDEEVFQTRAFRAFAEENLVLVKIDFPRNKELSEALQKQNAALKDHYQIRGFPTVIIADAQGKPLRALGYQPGGAEPFLSKIEFLIPQTSRPRSRSVASVVLPVRPLSFSKALGAVLNTALLNPANDIAWWTALGLGLLVMGVVLFQTQVSLGASRCTLQSMMFALAVGLSVLLGGAAAAKFYLFPALPSESLRTVHEAILSLFNKQDVVFSENVLAGAIGFVLFAVVGLPLTGWVFKSGFFRALYSWLVTLLAGLAMVFVVNLGVQALLKSGVFQDEGEEKNRQLLEQIHSLTSEPE